MRLEQGKNSRSGEQAGGGVEILIDISNNLKRNNRLRTCRKPASRNSLGNKGLKISSVDMNGMMRYTVVTITGDSVRHVS
jgi:hypothetical protein